MHICLENLGEAKYKVQILVSDFQNMVQEWHMPLMHNTAILV